MLASMDPAESKKLKQGLLTRAVRVNQHKTSLLQVMEHLQHIATSLMQLGGQLDTLKDQLTPSSGAATPATVAHQQANPAPPAREPYIPIPARYSGDLGNCSQFLRQCNLVISQQPNTYVTSQAKVTSVMSLLTGQAAAWSFAMTSQQIDFLNNHI